MSPVIDRITDCIKYEINSTTEIIDNSNLQVKYFRASTELRKYDMIKQIENIFNN